MNGLTFGISATEQELRAVCDPDGERRRANEAAGHSLCEHCNGTGNELYAMYRACPECGGDGITLKYGALSPLMRALMHRRDRRRHEKAMKAYREPRDLRLSFRCWLSYWFGIGQYFHDKRDECWRCEAVPSDVEFAFRRVGRRKAECLELDYCEPLDEAGGGG